MGRIDLSSRAAIEAQIESLITFLDEIDGDWDLEPSIGFGLGMDGLLEIDLELDETDREPSLGSSAAEDQRQWSNGGWQDCEEEGHDDIADEDALAEALEHLSVIEAFRASDNPERREERKRLWWKAVEKSHGRGGIGRVWRLGDPIRGVRINDNSRSFVWL
ncbi:MAG: hypothetical protein KAG89_12200 [Fulvimarina manganoxydans]|uniref:hypothetical protein n=1 Tax=Fulvimarina manganoxydans TaxID=937218 RepID=UPI0023521CFE|nr:hypothetical protein [Fulvimarina manganoxydans]MCK5932920.1 hypothetical protein [Fulvimarina manganoxydans]